MAPFVSFSINPHISPKLLQYQIYKAFKHIKQQRVISKSVSSTGITLNGAQVGFSTSKVLRWINKVILDSNDDVARAVALKLTLYFDGLRIVECLVDIGSDSIEIQQAIRRRLIESTSPIEISAAIDTTDIFLAQSEAFATNVIDDLATMIQDPKRPADVKERIIYLLRHMHYNIQLATRARKICTGLLERDIPLGEEVFPAIILKTLTLLTKNAVFEMSNMLEESSPLFITQSLSILRRLLCSNAPKIKTYLLIKILGLKSFDSLVLHKNHSIGTAMLSLVCDLATEGKHTGDPEVMQNLFELVIGVLRRFVPDETATLEKLSDVRAERLKSVCKALLRMSSLIPDEQYRRLVSIEMKYLSRSEGAVAYIMSRMIFLQALNHSSQKPLFVDYIPSFIELLRSEAFTTNSPAFLNIFRTVVLVAEYSPKLMSSIFESTDPWCTYNIVKSTLQFCNDRSWLNEDLQRRFDEICDIASRPTDAASAGVASTPSSVALFQIMFLNIRIDYLSTVKNILTALNVGRSNPCWLLERGWKVIVTSCMDILKRIEAMSNLDLVPVAKLGAKDEDIVYRVINDIDEVVLKLMKIPFNLPDYYFRHAPKKVVQDLNLKLDCIISQSLSSGSSSAFSHSPSSTSSSQTNLNKGFVKRRDERIRKWGKLEAAVFVGTKNFERICYKDAEKYKDLANEVFNLQKTDLKVVGQSVRSGDKNISSILTPPTIYSTSVATSAASVSQTITVPFSRLSLDSKLASKLTEGSKQTSRNKRFVNILLRLQDVHGKWWYPMHDGVVSLAVEVM
ncbi:hypothetical protein BKA69DRAFT_1037934 [Paraphysoderma sedebokerense]|nr:hypothetical protein BKA69DRAFT_1037934 [Paraphysoderma sedebokerense]